MGAISAALKHMLAAGMDYDAIVKAVADMEASEAPVKTARQLRNARYYQAKASEKRLKASNQDVSDESVLVPSRARVEVKTSNLDIEPVEKKDTPRAALMAILDETHAAAVVEHRQRIRKPLTAYAAAKLAAKFAACPDPNAAADKMIGNGWQGFEPEWMSKPDARGSPSSKPLSAQEILKARRQVNPDDDRPPNRPVLIASR